MAEADVKIAREPRAAPAWVAWGRRGIRLLPRGRYVLMNWLSRHYARPFDTALGVTRDRVHFVCDLRDAISREACFMGYYEPQETALVRHLLRPGMCFVDVGANWGYFTLLAADLVGARGRVVAFEPHPELFKLLAENVERNNFSWVAALRVAAADVEGEMNLAGFTTRGSNYGTSRLTKTPDPSVPNFRVATQPLETLLARCGVGDVDLLKMDIEGGEATVLPTLRRGLASGRYKHILLELHPEALAAQGVSARKLIEELQSFGYRAWRLDHSPEAFRRAAYRLPASPRQFLLPLGARAGLGDWPHLLFVAPGVTTTWAKD